MSTSANLGGVGPRGGGDATSGMHATGGVTSTQSTQGGVVTTGGTGSTGGRLSTGGTAGTTSSGGLAGATGIGATSSTGGRTPVAGTTAAAGTAGSAGTRGAGCSGGLEAVETINGHNLCVATMVLIPGETSDTGSTDYRIDATEVTKGQYHDWLMTTPTLPTSLDGACGWKSSWNDADPATATDGNADHHPIASVDWCDAFWYCAGVGKRLCGKMGGGANDPIDMNAAGIDQWYTACTSDGVYAANGYPYGQVYSSTACNGVDAAKGGTVAVATMASCRSSVATIGGIFDLSGNVAEWEDACDGYAGKFDGCRIRGGAFDNFGFDATPGSGEMLSCGVMLATNRFATVADVGFRCCSL
jgi:formylglycine-generating enzyme